MAEEQATELANRITTINDATTGVFNAIMAAVGDSPDAKQAEAILAPALTLLNCGLIALTEIAAAQMETVALSKLDLEAHIAAAVKERAEALAEQAKKDLTKRSFMGQKSP